MRRRAGANHADPRGHQPVYALIAGPAVAFVLLLWWCGSGVFTSGGVWMFVVACALFGLSLSLWILFAMPWLAALMKSPSRWVREGREAQGLCGGCGYDLRGGHDRCPECGEKPPHII